MSFPAQRNAALAFASADWVFFVDADEQPGDGLAAEIRAALDAAGQSASEGAVAGFWIPRKNLIWGGWIKHGGWYPDCQLRLLRRERARYVEAREVHEVVELDGEARTLANHLVHNNYERLRQFLDKQDLYSTLEASTMFRAGIHPRSRNYVLQPLREWWRRYVRLLGYRDGWRGLVLAVLLGYYNFVTYRKLGRLWRSGAEAPPL